MTQEEFTRLVVIGLVLGIVAASVVWFLERFEIAKLHGEVRGYLEKYESFRAWETEHGGD